LLIIFRQRYPRWWFDFSRELTRFGARVSAYAALLTDRYPSTVEEQSVHLEIDYPDAETDLNRWLPLVKWLLAIPHYIVLCFLSVAAFFAGILAWFAILVTGQYPQALFDFMVGVGRWWLRVTAYAFLLVTDRYPPFSLNSTGSQPTLRGLSPRFLPVADGEGLNQSGWSLVRMCRLSARLIAREGHQVLDVARGL
jgi:hypothetical protein